jgi:hypothetical protein
MLLMEMCILCSCMHATNGGAYTMQLWRDRTHMSGRVCTVCAEQLGIVQRMSSRE